MRQETCVVCLTKIYRTTGHSRNRTRRSIQSVTCSSSCSRKYRRVSKIFRREIIQHKREITRLEEELKYAKITNVKLSHLQKIGKELGYND